VRRLASTFFIRRSAASPGNSEGLCLRTPGVPSKTQSDPGLADAAMRKLRDRLSMKTHTLSF
jgi:hypothetical protein